MNIHYRGVPKHINETIVGRITRDSGTFGSNYVYLHDASDCFTIPNHFTACISENEIQNELPSVSYLGNLRGISEGDIVSLDPKGNLNLLFRVNSDHNSLLVTDQCNSNCLMCSQPPKNRDDIEYLFNINSRVISLIPQETKYLGITGGEPTLLRGLFFQFLKNINDILPNTEVQILTNGRKFAESEFVLEFKNLNHHQMVFCIPLYSDFYQLHDYIVQVRGAYDETLMGLYNLAQHKCRIEIRVVLHKQSIGRLVKLAKFIYKNLPFVEHIALMGLENMGYTPFNKDLLWIDPAEYQDQLEEAVSFLSQMGMNVSILNHQLCILPQTMWSYSRKSISDWKNVYLNECNHCSQASKCGGFFSSNTTLHSKYIKAIT